MESANLGLLCVLALFEFVLILQVYSFTAVLLTPKGQQPSGCRPLISKVGLITTVAGLSIIGAFTLIALIEGNPSTTSINHTLAISGAIALAGTVLRLTDKAMCSQWMGGDFS